VLSDLYACKVLLQVKIVGGAQKTRKVEFASLEHAVRAQNDTPSTHWGGLKRCDSRQTKQEFVTTQKDALCFLAQFEAGGCLRRGRASTNITPSTTLWRSPRAYTISAHHALRVCQQPQG